jgi:hypothetical protein
MMAIGERLTCFTKESALSGYEGVPLTVVVEAIMVVIAVRY